MPPSITALFPLVNGHAYSFASVEVYFADIPVPLITFKAINYEADLEPGEIRGSDPHVLGFTRGNHTTSGDAEVYLAAWEILKRTLGAGGIGYGETFFDIVVQYHEFESPIVTDILRNVRITKSQRSNQQGTDGTTQKLTFKMLDINENGAYLAVPISP
jgi:hypothetical protein